MRELLSRRPPRETWTRPTARAASLADFGHDAFGNALVVQGDGKVMVAGTATSLFGTTSDVAAARFGTDGTLDASFGQGGKSLLDFGHNETGYGAALQPDGKILVAGDIDGIGGTSDALVTRFNADGTLDSLFGQSGKAQVNVGGAVFVRGMALRADGRIDLAGYQYDGTHYHPLILQLDNPTGTPDASFHSNGSILFPTFEQMLASIAIAPDGTVAATGDYTPSIGSTLHDFVFAVASDHSYTVDPRDLGGSDSGTAVAVQPDGKILFAGYTDVGGTVDFAVIRLSEGGALDPSFGTGGKEIVDLGGSDTAQAIALQPDGKILLAGTTTKSGSSSQIGVVRLLPTGQPDTTFGTNGISIPSLTGVGKLQGAAIGLQSDGKIVIGGTIVPTGSSQKDFLVVRLEGDTSANGGGGSGGGGSTTPTTGGGSTQPGARNTKGAAIAASKLKLSPSSFAALASGPSVTHTAKRGAALSFTLNLAGKVVFNVQTTVAGRKVTHNGKTLCTRPTVSNRGKPGCRRVVSLTGGFSVAGLAGPNTISFTGRLSGHKLPPGHHTLVATPTNGTQHGTPVRAGFTISG